MPIRFMLRGQLIEVEPQGHYPINLLSDRAQRGGGRGSLQTRSGLQLLSRELLMHRGHEGLRRCDSPLDRIIGLQCACETPAFEIQIPLTTLRGAAREVRDFIDGASRQGRRERQKAEARARALLHEMLTREQRWSLKAEGSFSVQGQDGRMYAVRRGQTVQLLEGGQPVTSYCIHPSESIPEADVMLIQKLLLENDIEHFFANANATSLVRAG